jgi:Cd2+/Zn2+-exporting ATPase
MAVSSAYKLRIEGMDCGACAIKIENAMKRLPGVSDINVSYGQESMSIMLDQERTSPKVIEDKVKALGFTPVATEADGGQETRKLPDYHDQAWWKGKKGRLVIYTGLMFAAAWIIAHIDPAWGQIAYSVAALIAIIPFARRAIAGAFSGTPFSIETLMSVAALGALLIGAAEESAVVILLFAVGELLETIAAGRARAGIKALIDLLPRVALRERDGVTEKVSVEELAIDDIVIVRPGDRVPSDGKVVEGASEVNEAPVTGESVPVTKEIGSKVYAGSINTDAELKVAITHLAANNTISRIIHMVEEAQASKAPMARLIDRFSAWYTPAAMLVAALVIVIPPVFFGGDWTTWIYRGLSTLLIACPCALVISTPAAIASGLAAGARRGLLIKGGAALETLGKVRTVAFDKTGTLTLGRPQVTDIVAVIGNEDDVLARAAAVERNTSHPLGVAITEAAKERDLTVPASFGGARATAGKAVTARLKNGFVSVGSPRFAAEQTEIDTDLAARITVMESEGKTVVVVMMNGKIEGLIALRDEPRPDAASAVAKLRDMGIVAVMLTGDNQRTATAIGAQLGLNVKAELLPDAKLAEIDALKAAGPIAMIGDGINDAPALATASVGVAMGGGTDVALETAEAALLRDRVMGVAELVALSQATLSNIWQNIALALGLKAIFLATTLFGATTLWMAILADTGATVLVTANALRLLGHGRRSRDI